MLKKANKRETFLQRHVVSRWRKYTLQEKIVLTVATVIFTVYSVYLLAPYFFAIMNSLKSTTEYYESMYSFPTELRFDNYLRALELSIAGTSVLEMFLNNLGFAFTFAFGTVACSTLTAYVVSRYNFRGRYLLYTIAVIVQIVPIFGTTGAGYRLVYNLHLDNNFLLTWIIGAGGFNFIFVIMHSFFISLGREYAEAAMIDGAGHFRIFFSIMLPMAAAPLLAVFTTNFIGIWNDYLSPRLYMPEYPTLAVGIDLLRTTSTRPEMGGMPVYLAAIMISIIPVLLLFCLVQKKVLNVDFGGGIKG